MKYQQLILINASTNDRKTMNINIYSNDIRKLVELLFYKYKEIKTVENYIQEIDENTGCIRVLNIDLHKYSPVVGSFKYNPLHYIGVDENCDEVPILSYYRRSMELINKQIFTMFHE